MSRIIEIKVVTDDSNLVSIDWLHENLETPNLVLLDATMKLAPNGDPIHQLSEYIPGTQSFNFDTEICDQNSALPHMLCSSEEFETAANHLGINQDSTIVVYDAMGIFSSPRVWWMFKIMGHQNVFVLNGGMPAWKKAKLQTQIQLKEVSITGTFRAEFNPKLLTASKQILRAIETKSFTVFDARSYSRFNADENEPRTELLSGHIPGSICFPFTSIVEDGFFKRREQLIEIIRALLLSIDDEEIGTLVFSCGSGVTACILALAFSECGYENWSVFDGSWSEWGQKSHNFPIDPS